MSHDEYIQYWENYYKNHKKPGNPSPFGIYIAKTYLKPGKYLELGCGNGRDSVYLSSFPDINFLGVDLSEHEIEYLNLHYANDTLKFLCRDFTRIPETTRYNGIYSRFTLHSIDAESQNRTLDWVYSHLAETGQFYLEARSTKDPLCGQGKKVADNAYVTDHYRRFINFDLLQEQLKNLGFSLIEAVESNGLAVYKEEDPVVIRIIAQK